MRFLSHLHDTQKTIAYDSVLRLKSAVLPGVEFAIRRMSFGARMELSRGVRELSRKVEFLEAGTDVEQKVEASVLTHEIDDLFLRWGLEAVEGLTIDGVPATPNLMADRGPEGLAREIIDAIKTQWGLSEEERKN